MHDHAFLCLCCPALLEASDGPIHSTRNRIKCLKRRNSYFKKIILNWDRIECVINDEEEEEEIRVHIIVFKDIVPLNEISASRIAG
jgi:hypothetical protein